ncbi:hypothetical protein FPQ18DRAFT_252646 [Pyronema domesticum]|nr:hypothetical protein FPQ18DRAFT_252646 [Pyronema domesticum]
MKITNVLLLAALATEAAAWGFGKTTYNKWHQTELERWLADHDIPYPTPADRKDLEKIVQDNWQTRVVDYYKSWDAPQLQSYLSETGKELDAKRKEDKNWLVQQVKAGWHETEKSAGEAFEHMKDWVFDSWTESQLKSFLDRHGIPNPNPRTRDALLATARDNYQTVADKLGETAAYPGNWLYESWSESDLKKWLDERGYPAPQPTTRDKLIAAVRRNSRLAAIKAQKNKNAAAKTISDTVFDTWSESSLKEFLDKNNVKVPQGSTKNELLALARRNKAYLTGDTVYNSAASAASYATSVAGDKAASAAAQATDAASHYGQIAFDKAIEAWSDTRLKAYLDSRGVPVPQASKRDELLAKVRLHKHKAATGYGAWTFDTWTKENLIKWLESQGHKVSKEAAESRDQLYKSAASYYQEASASAASAASHAYASITSALAQATEAAKDASFDTWSNSDLKSYLDTYGIKTYQGTTRNELIAMARRNAHYFRYGSDDMGVWGQVKNAAGYVQNTISSLLGYGTKVAQKAGDRAYESAQVAADAAKEKATQAKHRVQEEL